MGYWDDYLGQANLQKYGSNSLLLYTLQSRFDIDDIDSVASEAITDGSDDKKCDMIYIDEDRGIAVVAQGYIRQNPLPDDLPKGNKACDLNTAIAWIFGRDIADIPAGIKSAVTALKDCIERDKINSLFFWYVHNCKESKHISDEMKTVETTAKSSLDRFFPHSNLLVSASEIGNETLESLYSFSQNVIVVSGEISIPLLKGGLEVASSEWRAFQTCISGKQLYQLSKQHGDNLFSANPRRFLGIDRRAKARIINAGIKTSAEESPANFWAYNNGITALTHSFKEKDAELICNGISIINGAQTTGSIGSMEQEPHDDLFVSIRIIECSSNQIIKAIIDNNNKQNEMLPSDFRSNDRCQSNLRKGFEKYPSIYYSGGLRSSEAPRGREVFDHLLTGQILVAYNGDPVSAYNDKTNIWNDDKLYGTIFNDELTPEHTIFVYSLSKTIDKVKVELQQMQREDKLLDHQKKQLEFLSRRGSRIMLFSAIARNLEIITEKKITCPQKLRFEDCSNFENCIKWWHPIVAMTLSFYQILQPALSAGGLDSKEKAQEAISSIGANINALYLTSGATKDQFSGFISKIRE